MKKLLSVVIAIVLLMEFSTTTFALEIDKLKDDSKQNTISQIESDRKSALNSVYKQLKDQGVEDQFDKWVKDDINKMYDQQIYLIQNRSSGNNMLRANIINAPNGASVSYKREYANTLEVYLNREQSIKLRNGRKDLLSYIAGGISIPVGLYAGSIGAALGLLSSVYGGYSLVISNIVNNGGCIVSVVAETTDADPDGGGRRFGYYAEWKNYYNINVTGAYDYVIK